MTITEIFEELNTVYNQAWFDDAQEKFYNHPANKKRENNFSITLTDPKEDDFTMVITFENFVFGVRCDEFDDIHDDREMDKLEQVGSLPNGYPNMELPIGVQFNSSDEYYPNPSLQDWQNKIITKIDKSLSLITNLAEKELLIDALDAFIKYYKESLEVDDNRFVILSNILNTVYEYISDISKEISELNTFIEDKKVNKVIHFNLDQAGLAKLIKLLFEKGILDNSETSNQKIMEWFSRNSLVNSKTSKRIFPKTLKEEFRRLSTKKLDLVNWFCNLK